MFVCICHQVGEQEVRRCVRAGACTEDAVGDACEAGTGCGTCLERIAAIIEAESPASALASTA